MTSNRDGNLDRVSIFVCCPSCGNHYVTYVKQQVFNRTINSGGISVVVRELGINPNTDLSEIKKNAALMQQVMLAHITLGGVRLFVAKERA
ncbi:hypothetical protein CRENPOLYSF1_100069 [Crenothrix polyspora]|uniref:Uncharacterized protein n=1 Tax=Crenothrix polyspora TaxID=360316 RepID=A0A1R4GZ05_9GAMM|nr:hypothetical protein CRENPOLYSF1_100069 [Crenothrix polyspora]